MTFKYIELFAGIGGFRSALGGLGGECVFASEIDKYASQAYRALYDGAAELHGDITEVNAHDIPDHDVLVGGFPCQAFSVAGQRKGFEDARGTLFFEIARIASTKQPRLMLLENVKGLLSHDGGKTFETMCAILNDIGYAIDFRVLNSKHFGVPQNRERIFIACDRDAEHAEWDVTGSDVVARAKRRAQALGIRTFNFDWPENSEVSTRLRDVLETQIDDKHTLNNCAVTRLLNGGTGFRSSLHSEESDGVARTLFASMYKIARGMDLIKTSKGSIRKLTPRECWRLQGFTDAQHDAVMNAGISDSQRYKQAGNAVTVNVIRAVGRPLVMRLKQTAELAQQASASSSEMEAV